MNDRLRQTVFYEPAHDSGLAAYRLDDGSGSPALSASATKAKPTAATSGR